MAGGKETPRQRMISILYLVLLGLVALNVSDSILDAFKNIGNSLSTSTQNTQAGIDNMFLAFRETKLKEEPERAAPVLQKAEQAQVVAQTLTDKVKELGELLTSEGGGLDEVTGDVKFRASTDVAARLMINEGRANELRQLISTTKTELLKLVDDEIDITLDALDPNPRGGVQKSWEEANFGDGIPLTAAITALEKIKADTKNAESAIIKHIFGKMDQAVVNLDRFAAVAVAPTSYLILGQPYTAKVFLTAYDSRSNPNISVNGTPLTVTDGQGDYTVNTSQPGIFTWQGTIRVQQTDGQVKVYETEPMTYQVARPSAVVSPDAMNVLYIGVDNPISVSSPGIPSESIRVSGSGAGISIRPAGSQYVARVGSTGEAVISVSANIDGKAQRIGSSKFRVKRIPKPTARVGGKAGGRISVTQLRGQNFLSAALDDFEFDAKFAISRFSMYIQNPRVDPLLFQQPGGASFTAQMKSGLNGVTVGSVVMIYDIVGKGPDGMEQNLDGIIFQVTN